MINTKQMIAGILIGIGVFGMGFACGYNFCWNQLNPPKYNVTEYEDYETVTDVLDVNKLNWVRTNDTMEHKDIR